MKKLVIITGPTAVGKTEISIKLAKAINGEIISADSIQVYKKLDVGSAKISTDEMNGVKHYLIDILNPDEEFNVYTFKKLACDAMDEIYAKGKIPIIVGGTGFYIQSVLYDVKFDETDDTHPYRKELEILANEKGNVYLHNKLKEVDPDSAEIIHPNNVKRVIRALEFYQDNNSPISKHNKEQHENKSPYKFAYYVLNDERDLLYKRINQRVDKMFEDGLVDEVNNLKSEGYDDNLLSMQGIGYKEVFEYLNGNITLDEVKELIKKNTRHFAKRQLTWFRREKEIEEVNYSKFEHNIDKALEYIINRLKEKEII